MYAGSGAYLCSSHPPPMPRLLLPTALAPHHLSLAFFYCYSCPRLCHSLTWLLIHTLRWSPCCTHRMPRMGGITRPGHVSGYMLDGLHWLPFQQQIIFRIAALVWRCLLGLAVPPRVPEVAAGGDTFWPFFPPYFPKADPCILGAWPLC